MGPEYPEGATRDRADNGNRAGGRQRRRGENPEPLRSWRCMHNQGIVGSSIPTFGQVNCGTSVPVRGHSQSRRRDSPGVRRERTEAPDPGAPCDRRADRQRVREGDRHHELRPAPGGDAHRRQDRPDHGVGPEARFWGSADSAQPLHDREDPRGLPVHRAQEHGRRTGKRRPRRGRCVHAGICIQRLSSAASAAVSSCRRLSIWRSTPCDPLGITEPCLHMQIPQGDSG